MTPRAPQCAAGVLLALLLLAGCNEPQAGQTAPVAPAAAPAANVAPNNQVKSGWDRLHLSHAQPRLPTVKLWLGAEVLKAEIADEPVEVATGMMFRESMAEDEGMIFVFPLPHRTGFYMKNTKVPLSVAYIDTEGVIREIHDLQPLNEESVEAKSDQIQFVLEVPQGWFQRHRIGEGTEIRTEMGSLRETFIAQRKRK